MGIFQRFFSTIAGSDQQTDYSTNTSVAPPASFSISSEGRIIGTNETFAKYESYLANDNTYRTVKYGDKGHLGFADPKRIEGITVTNTQARPLSMSFNPYQSKFPQSSVPLNQTQGPDIDSFWRQHGRTHEDYLELTSHIPEINDRLAGKSPSEQEEIIQTLQHDPQLGDCARLCYMPNNRVQVYEVDDFYAFQEGGRHRVLAARENMEIAREEAVSKNEPFDESRYKMPIQVMGREEKLEESIESPSYTEDDRDKKEHYNPGSEVTETEDNSRFFSPVPEATKPEGEDYGYYPPSYPALETVESENHGQPFDFATHPVQTKDNAQSFNPAPETPIAEENAQSFNPTPEASKAEENAQSFNPTPEAPKAEENTQSFDPAPEAPKAEENAQSFNPAPEAPKAEENTQSFDPAPENTRPQEQSQSPSAPEPTPAQAQGSNQESQTADQGISL